MTVLKVVSFSSSTDAQWSFILLYSNAGASCLSFLFFLLTVGLPFPSNHPFTLTCLSVFKAFWHSHYQYQLLIFLWNITYTYIYISICHSSDLNISAFMSPCHPPYSWSPPSFLPLPSFLLLASLHLNDNLFPRKKKYFQLCSPRF